MTDKSSCDHTIGTGTVSGPGEVYLLNECNYLVGDIREVNGEEFNYCPTCGKKLSWKHYREELRICSIEGLTKILKAIRDDGEIRTHSFFFDEAASLGLIEKLGTKYRENFMRVTYFAKLTPKGKAWLEEQENNNQKEGEKQWMN